MKKKVPVVKGARRGTPERVRDLDFEARVTMADLSESIHEELMAMVTSAGLTVMHELLEAEITERIGLKRAQIPAGERVGHRHGSTEGSLVLGDRKVSVVRPQARSVGGHEIEVDTWDLVQFRGPGLRESGIVNDPNKWAEEHNDPFYIVWLVAEIVRVSVETMKIVDSLPALGP